MRVEKKQEKVELPKFAPNYVNRKARYAMADSTSKHGSKSGGRKMRAKADKRMMLIMAGREKINKLMARAGVRATL